MSTSCIAVIINKDEHSKIWEVSHQNIKNAFDADAGNVTTVEAQNIYFIFKTPGTLRQSRTIYAMSWPQKIPIANWLAGVSKHTLNCRYPNQLLQ